MLRAFNDGEGVVRGVTRYDTVIWYMVTDVSEEPAVPILDHTAMQEMGMLWDINPLVPRDLVYPTCGI
jgi:hypothetical protein